MNLLDQIPGYREAVAAEAAAREAAFLRIPETIAGLIVEPLTLRHVALMSQAGLDRELDRKSLDVLLWLLSPDFTVRPGLARWWRRFRRSAAIAWAIFRRGEVAVALEADLFLAEAYDDAPHGAPADGAFRPSATSRAADYVDILAAEYGWTADEILDLPIRAAHQLVRAIRRRIDPRATFFNASDRIRTEWLRKQNAKHEAVNRN